VAFDLPTLMGYDADHRLSEGEVGKCGVAIDSLEDMEILFAAFPGEDHRLHDHQLAGLGAVGHVPGGRREAGRRLEEDFRHLQNDILKEYIAQKEYIYPPAPSMRLVTDTFEFGSKHTPRFNTISISGYHIREAGSTAVQELAFTCATAWSTWSGRSGAASTSTSSRRASASSSTRTTISSRRSPSTAPRARSGIA
jgi:methylmalonyl-CoA mutase N-terminal domain/subunit